MYNLCKIISRCQHILHEGLCKIIVKKHTPTLFILLAGINDLYSNQTSKVIAKEIVDFATSLQRHQHDVSVSKVNEILLALCHEKNIYLIDLNKGKLYLNKNGSNILNCTFVNEISKIFN